MRPVISLVSFVSLLVALSCDQTEVEPLPAFGEPEYEGLSREEIQTQAEAMTLEEAERLGIVDTTIRIEPPVNPDSILPIPAIVGGQ